MYSKGGVLTVVKGLMTLEQFFHEWESVPDDCPVAVHFRIRSHGEKNAEMTHPFHIGTEGTLALVHNGMLSGTNATFTSAKSDTCHFVEDTLNKLPVGWESSEAIIDLITHRIGYGNKMVILRNDGEHVILNKIAGVVEDGVWYSNSSFLPKVHKPLAPVTGSCGYGWSRKYSRYNHEDDADAPIQFPTHQDDVSKGVQVFTENSDGIKWDTKSGKWIRLTAQNRGVMLFRYNDTMLSFICEGYTSWKALRNMSPKPGEADIRPEDARKHFGIPEPHEPINLDQYCADQVAAQAATDDTAIITHYGD
jgi:hypothetical protein